MTNEKKLEWMMHQISTGRARIERNEYCIDGLRYSRGQDGWADLYDVIHYKRPITNGSNDGTGS